MGLGASALNTNQRREKSGSPFTPASAINGLSVDTAGKVVLGQEMADGTNPAIFLDDRLIPVDGFKLRIANVVGETLDINDVNQGPMGISIFDFTRQFQGFFDYTEVSFNATGTSDAGSMSAQVVALQNATNSVNLNAQKLEFDVFGGLGSMALQVKNADATLDFINTATASVMNINQVGDLQVLHSVLSKGDGVTGGLQVNSNGVGSNSFAQVLLRNNVNSNGQLFLTASTNSGLAGPDALGFYNDGAGGIKILSANAAGAILLATGAGVVTAMTVKPTQVINLTNVQVFASNALAIAGGLVVGDLYKDATGIVHIVI